jgi:hypothetical protein
MIVVRRGKDKPERFAVCGFFIRPRGRSAHRSQEKLAGGPRWVWGIPGVGQPGDLMARWRRWEFRNGRLHLMSPPPAVRPFVHSRPGCTVPAICSTKRCGCWVWRTAWCYQKSQARGVGVVLWMSLLMSLLSSVWTSSRPESMDEEDPKLGGL